MRVKNKKQARIDEISGVFSQLTTRFFNDMIVLQNTLKSRAFLIEGLPLDDYFVCELSDLYTVMKELFERVRSKIDREIISAVRYGTAINIREFIAKNHERIKQIKHTHLGVLDFPFENKNVDLSIKPQTSNKSTATEINSSHSSYRRDSHQIENLSSLILQDGVTRMFKEETYLGNFGDDPTYINDHINELQKTITMMSPSTGIVTIWGYGVYSIEIDGENIRTNQVHKGF